MDLSESKGTPRSVVYYGSDVQNRSAYIGLEENGWRVLPIPDPADAGRIIRSQDINVGVMRLNGDALDEKDAPLENLFSETERVRWVGLVEPQSLDDLRMRRLISSYLYDFHTLPTSFKHLSSTLGHAYGMANIELPDAVNRDHSDSSHMVANSDAMQVAKRDIKKIAQADAPAIISGESGTGKELAARAIHNQSNRSGEPFVAVNCGALAASLIQSELFGHEKGAFTGAHRERIGRIEAANGGTIFLDEIGDLSLDLQINLLRFLQEGTIERVGQAQPIHINARVLVATHVDLHEAVKKGRFREDLYYRLNVLKLELPPLRERDGDIESLIKHYFQVYRKERKKNIRGFTANALQAMYAHDWPGNVRELINKIRRGVVMCERSLITARELGFDQPKEEHCIKTLAEVRAGCEKRAIRQTLHRSRYNISLTARKLGISRLTLYRLIEKYELNKDDMDGVVNG